MIKRLQTEKRAGVPHYKRGQHQAWRVADDSAALLLYVDAMGWACFIMCEREREGDEWRPVLAARQSANGVGERWREPKPSYRLSDAARRALDAAEVVEAEEMVERAREGEGG